MDNTTRFHRIASTSFVLVATVACFATAAPAAGTPIPPMPHACAETTCVVIRASAEMACAEASEDPDSCEMVLVELQRCFDQCPDSQ